MLDRVCHERIAEFCCKPAGYRFHLERWLPRWEDSVRCALAPLFGTPIELRFLEYMVGETMIDPSAFSKFVMLYGPGGNGKTMVINTIASVADRCSDMMPTAQFTGESSDIGAYVSGLLVANRIVYNGEVELTKRDLSLSFVKFVTGHDRVSTRFGSYHSSCSVFMGTNSLPRHPRSAWNEPAIMRRVVVLPMLVRAREAPKVALDFDETARLSFLMRCVHTRLTCPFLPVSGRMVLATLLASRYERYWTLFVSDPDSAIPNANARAVEAVTVLSMLLTASEAEVISMSRQISESAVRRVWETDVIQGVYLS